MAESEINLEASPSDICEGSSCCLKNYLNCS
ncbi:rCG24781 [Rattus norvegicus]|uniref:RCG24781 n=1 Tax=Rattus norvegicus TaxID=10116 RepID=A6JBJ0_RAT|nr:rCG24781 [Rattus norvegicus]